MIASHWRQENRSRTVWITFHWRGTTSSVSVTSSPSFESFVDPQHGQSVGAAITTRSRGKCSGIGFRAGRLRSKDFTKVEGPSVRGQLVLGRVCLGVLHLHLQLVDEPLLAFRARAVERAPQLFDLQLQPRDQRLGAGGGRLSVGQIRISLRCARLALPSRCPLGEDQRMRRNEIGRGANSNVFVTSEKYHDRADL